MKVHLMHFVRVVDGFSIQEKGCADKPIIKNIELNNVNNVNKIALKPNEFL